MSHLSLCGRVLRITPLLRHHLESIPITAGEVEGPGPHFISLQDIQAPGPVQGVVHLVQLQEYRVKDLLPHGHNLLEKFDLEVGSTCTATRPESMEGFVVGGGGGEVAIYNHGHRLPNHLHETYAMVLSSPFWD